MKQQEKTEILAQIDERIKQSEDATKIFEKNGMLSLENKCAASTRELKKVRQLIESKEVTE